MATPSPRRPEENQPILIADGDSGNVRHVERLLREAGVRNPIHAFPTGPGLRSFFDDIIQGEEPKPCVLFLDPRTPGVGGYDPVRWIKRTSQLDMKVVVFSSTNYPEEIEGAGELGVHLFLKKHPDLGSLSTIVDHLCGVQQSERQPWNTYAAPSPSQHS